MDTASALDEQVRATIYLGIRLGTDLERLDRVAAVDAHEATILYAGRILEVISAEEVQRSRGMPSGNLYGNLIQLTELGALPEVPARLFHTLRRLANEVRHVSRPIAPDDARIAHALVLYVLGWHFTLSRCGPQLPSIWSREHHRTDHLAELVSLFEHAPTSESLHRAWQADPLLEGSTFGAALVAEMLLAVDDRASARAIVDAALVRDREDLRLRQLDAWIARDEHGPAEAAVRLEALLAEREDVETLGLLAGTYKRLGQTRRAADLYNRAWKQSDARSTYAGINAASMLLVSGERDRAIKIAKQLDAMYERRRTGAEIVFAGYWDRATYAEVKLLIGATAEAARAYRDTFARHAAQPGLVASTKRQLQELLPVVMPHAPDLDAFLAG